MKNNEQFAVAIHILTYLSLSDKDYVTSDEIAHSVNTSSVVIRRIIGLLKKRGLILTKQGVGGSKLAKDPQDISLYDVYCALNSVLAFGLHSNINEDCVIANQVNEAIKGSLQDSYDAFNEKLGQKSIQDIVNKIK
ncbi:hypothetical protein AOC36_07495 [Erysipelothrix larvae]|uniref:Rrf2 family transcriptional regulator n=1 Tax=Erysipelothrix larvae TaxID=1514105 RepID=A0A0X8H0J1_9FIRM|nr:Rrf2 family transcriptional regulator [Erysipelothrix larvae]AMC93833.1 hypothetical protein AOC36_07495 [Erysipelothrix larvae]